MERVGYTGQLKNSFVCKNCSLFNLHAPLLIYVQDSVLILFKQKIGIFVCSCPLGIYGDRCQYTKYQLSKGTNHTLPFLLSFIKLNIIYEKYIYNIYTLSSFLLFIQLYHRSIYEKFTYNMTQFCSVTKESCLNIIGKLKN